jgi:4-hydroxy-tetrahydrodipicolinate synthase
MTDFNWTGVLPATLCPFRDDDSIDEPGLRGYVRYLASVPGVTALTCNGHTGEVMSLRAGERVRVTQIIADEVGDRVKVVSGICCEGSDDAIDQARAAKAAGADAILLMPPHHWLRFGRTSETAIGYFHDVAEGADINIIVHQYPAWTKAGYSLAEMLELVKIPQVVSIKMGTRDMARWGYDYRELKRAAPATSIISCHDEYLLATLLDGADGALVGFAGFVPELIVELVRAALAGDLQAAYAAQERIRPLAQIVYRFGEPSSDAHQRMKCAMTLMGKFPSMRMRRPLRPLPPAEVERIRGELIAGGFIPAEEPILAAD